jgi:hypothetical protein
MAVNPCGCGLSERTLSDVLCLLEREDSAMSKPDPVGTNPNDEMPPGDGLKPGEIVPEEFEDEKLYGDDDGLGPVNEKEDEPGLPENIDDETVQDEP